VTPDGQGTGWVVDRGKKLLLTCQHVVGQREQVAVIFPMYEGGKLVSQRDFYVKNAQPIAGRVLRRDATRDLALIELGSLPDGVVELNLAGAAPEAGDTVHAIGCPGPSFAMWVYGNGMVRQVTDAVWTDDSRTKRSMRVIEHQIPLNPGDSGGPLLNDRAELVGVNQGGRGDAQLMSLSVTVDEVRAFMDSMPQTPEKADRLHRQAKQAIADKSWDEDEFYLVKALDADGQNVAALVDLAWLYNETKQYDKALAVCKYTVDKVDARNAGIWKETGYAFWKKGGEENLKLAAAALLISIEIKEEDPGSWEYLAKVFEELGLNEEAAKANDRAKELRRLKMAS
jgi:hypothetical protein